MVWYWILPILLLIAPLVWPGIWFRRVQSSIESTASITKRECAVGEFVQLEICIQQHRGLPIPYLHLTLHAPEGTAFNKEGDMRYLEWTSYLLPGQQISFVCQLYAMRRGPKSLRDICSIEIHEGFGLRRFRLSPHFPEQLGVYPDAASSQTLHSIWQALTGTRMTQRWILPDESLFKDVRPYVAGDPPKYFAWKTIARTGDWWVKQFETTTSEEWVVILNAQMQNPYWMEADTPTFDRLCALLLATVSQWQRGERGNSLFFASNALLSNYPQKHWYGSVTYGRLRSLLAVLESYPTCSLIDVLQEARRFSTSPRTPWLIVGAFFSAEQEQWMEAEKRRGRPIEIIKLPRWKEEVENDTPITAER
ncbi:DUF58 domain-containing protein [Alicyclobacillus tolerans]|uniref:DUF58 domain-containing protein n=1 Tax=Alicyclobacillus tolerans TaxID=90970 RepID=UPI003B81FBEA